MLGALPCAELWLVAGDVTFTVVQVTATYEVASLQVLLVDAFTGRSSEVCSTVEGSGVLGLDWGMGDTRSPFRGAWDSTGSLLYAAGAMCSQGDSQVGQPLVVQDTVTVIDMSSRASAGRKPKPHHINIDSKATAVVEDPLTTGLLVGTATTQKASGCLAYLGGVREAYGEE